MSSTSTNSTTFTGVITRICNFKYGFLSSDEHANIFFHFSELSDDAKAFVEVGTTVTFTTKPNGDKVQATGLQVTSAPGDNKFKDLEGVVQNGMQSRGFCFIKSDDETTYLFHSENLVNDDTSKEAGNTVVEGHKVIFDAQFNHKHSPPKPFATNVRIVPGQAEKNTESATLEHMPMRSSTTWQRSSRLGMDAADELSASPPRKLTRNSSVRDRASALSASAPVRRWSRTTNVTGEKLSDKPAGGLNMKSTTCKFGKRCTNKSCWFEHPNGRTIDGTATLTDEDNTSSGDEEAKITSMGKASLSLLVKAIVADTGKSSYLNVRNALQKAEYVGRALTREEKHSVGEILEELEGSSPTINTTKPRESFSRASSSNKAWSRGTGRSSFSRASFTGGRVSLADMCRDPSIHSRLSTANTGTCA